MNESAATPLVGQPLDRRDGRLKVTGAALYAADQPVKDVLHGVLVTSGIPVGRIAALDTGVGEAMPGVLLVLSHLNAPQLASGGRGPRPLALFQDDRVLYNGQPIAVVVADTLEHARAGADAVRVRYTRQHAALDFAANRSGATTPKEFSKGEADTRQGDVAAALDGGAHRIDAVYTTPMEHHNPLEPHATIASWSGDRVTVYDSTQSVSGARSVVARSLGIDPQQVHIVSPFVGGGFGCKGLTWSHVVIAAMAARVAGRPVKLVLERAQMWGPVGGRPMTEQSIALASTDDGRLVATRHEVISHTSTFEEFVESSALATRILYDSDTRATSHRLVRLDVGTPTFQRAPGEASGTFAIESAMDELAERAKIDPLDFRLRNYAERSPEGMPWSSKSLRECYRVGAERFGWARRDPVAGAMRDGDEMVGFGMATATYPTNRSKASARTIVGSDGVAVVQSGTQDIGTGTWTVMAQVAADALGFPMAQVRFELGDSTLPPAPGSGGSRSAASVAPAVQAACRDARAQLIGLVIADRGSPLHGATADHVTIRDGWFRSLTEPGRREPVIALLQRSGVPVRAEATTEPAADAKNHAMHAFGAVFVEARVDAELGRIHIPRVVGVYGVGHRLNAKTARSQLVGGIVWGISMALFEESLLDLRNGHFANASLAEYHVPVNADIGDIDVSFVDEEDPYINPLGIKGIGEIGITGVAGAIANAVRHATGKRVRSLPITVDRLLST